ncbi:MAG: exodeoxyribonuclease VII small subunit [Clostridia bacterium]|jgi:exonuclease VII small subunit
MSFEEALKELEGIVSELEKNQLTLEESVRFLAGELHYLLLRKKTG